MKLLDKIARGRCPRAQKVVIYSPEGFGKSTLAAHFPDPLFLDVEESTSQLAVNRLKRDDIPDLKTFETALSEIAMARPCETLVVDTIDWVQMMGEAELCKEHKQPSIVCNDKGSVFAFGRGVDLLKNRMTLLMPKFDALIKAGINVVLLAHSTIIKAEEVQQSGQYDRYELKLKPKISALFKEWADMLLFGNWRVQLLEKDKNEPGKQFVAVGGRERLLHCSRAQGWDAKNRHDLKDVELWGKDASEAIKVIERAFRNVGAPWGGEMQPSKVEKVPVPTMPKAAEVPDEIPMHHDPAQSTAGRSVFPAEAKAADALAKICAPHAAAINEYLISNNHIRAGEDWTKMPQNFADRVLRNPAGFLKVALNGKAVAA